MNAELLQTIRRDPKTVAVAGASQEEIDAAQQALGIRFPPSYVAFLRQFNGGEYRYLRMHSIGEEERNRKQAQEEAFSAPTYYGDVVGYVRDRDTFYATWKRPEDDEEARHYTNPFWEGVAARRYFPFADDFGGSYFCFDLATSDAAGEYRVLYWEHEDWSEPPRLVAANLTALLTHVFVEETKSST